MKKYPCCIEEFKISLKRKEIFGWLHAYSFIILFSCVVAALVICIWRIIKMIF